MRHGSRICPSPLRLGQRAETRKKAGLGDNVGKDGRFIRCSVTLSLKFFHPHWYDSHPICMAFLQRLRRLFADPSHECHPHPGRRQHARMIPVNHSVAASRFALLSTRAAFRDCEPSTGAWNEAVELHFAVQGIRSSLKDQKSHPHQTPSCLCV